MVAGGNLRAVCSCCCNLRPVMKRIGLLSDTHSYLDPAIVTHFEGCDEVWHCGDFGDERVVSQLQAFRPLRGVWGNIDGAAVRHQFPEMLSFEIEGLRVLMLHIGGYPGRYTAQAKAGIQQHQPGLFISGHSHILKIMPDEKHQLLHMNPGAAGRHGWHKVRTLIRFSISSGRLHACEVIELQ